MTGGAGGKHWVTRGAASAVRRHKTEKIYCDDPFQTVSGSIPGS